jgi:uncharacterized protein (DUF2236 family)
MIKGNGQQDDATLLTIASGLFAQFALSTKLDPGHREIADLGSVATSMFRNFEAGLQSSGCGSLDNASPNIGSNIHLLSETGTFQCQQV